MAPPSIAAATDLKYSHPKMFFGNFWMNEISGSSLKKKKNMGGGFKFAAFLSSPKKAQPGKIFFRNSKVVVISFILWTFDKKCWKIASNMPIDMVKAKNEGNSLNLKPIFGWSQVVGTWKFLFRYLIYHYNSYYTVLYSY